jgi:hypothetical protein
LELVKNKNMHGSFPKEVHLETVEKTDTELMVDTQLGVALMAIIKPLSNDKKEVAEISMHHEHVLQAVRWLASNYGTSSAVIANTPASVVF